MSRSIKKKIGGCWLSEVNTEIMDGQGLYLSILFHIESFLGTKQQTGCFFIEW